MTTLPPPTATLPTAETIRIARQGLENKQGEQIALIDVRGRSDVTDYYLMASAGSVPQIRAMSEEVQELLRRAGSRAHRVSGQPETEWVVLDYVDVVVHILSREAREYYDLEALWRTPGRTRPPA